MNQKTNNPKEVAQPSTAPKIGMFVEVTITGTDAEGFGIGTIENYQVMVPDSAAGDVVRIRIDHVSKQHPSAWGRIFEVISRGSKWKKHFCPEAQQSGGRCGGCPLGHLTKDAYRDVKINTVNETLRPASPAVQIPSLYTDSWQHYRNKSNFVVHKTKDGTLHLGSYAPRSHRFATMNGCKINTRIITKVQRATEAILTEHGAMAHPTMGGFRYVTIKSFETGAVLVELVVNADAADETHQSIAQQILREDSVHGVTLTCNNSEGNQIRTPGSSASSITIGRKDALIDKIGDIQLQMKASTFFQLNSHIAEQMYRQAALWTQQTCAQHDSAVIWDLYCGIGGLGLTATASDQKLYGCDSVSSAIELAQKNADINEKFTMFETVNLAKSFPSNWPNPNVILVNPPRKGIDGFALKQFDKYPSAKIIYMSCNPTTFARDTQLLAEGGFRLAAVEAYDMLPNTAHVELLGLFEPARQHD